MNIKKLFLLAAISLVLISCGTSGKEVVYVQNIDEIPPAALAATTQAGDFTIKPGDLLQINVASSNSDAVKPFNKVQYMPTYGSANYISMGDNSTVFYLVEDDGSIQFPILGTLHIKGMTKKAVEEYIASLIYPRYLIEKPDVECRIQNFRVFCLGDFTSPGVITAENGRLNLVEAIARCGDLTLQGQRENILLIRTDQSGQRTVKRIDITDARFMSMPEFELQQNDILYVEPNKYKKRSIWSLPPLYSAGVGIFGTTVSLLTFIFYLSDR